LNEISEDSATPATLKAKLSQHARIFVNNLQKWRAPLSAAAVTHLQLRKVREKGKRLVMATSSAFELSSSKILQFNFDCFDSTDPHY
jgi:hypothetical protein